MYYFGLWKSYFTQDEWYYFGLFNEYRFNPLGFIHVFIEQFTNPKLYGIHFTPLYNSLLFLEYQVFGLNFRLYALLSMFLHVISSLLVSYLAFKLTASRKISFLSGLFFAVAYSHTEAVTWANTHLQTQIPTILTLIILPLWLKALRQDSKKLFLISLILLLVALLIKETVLGIFGVLFFMTLLYGKREQFKKTFIFITGAGLIYGIFRFILPHVLYRLDNSLQLASSLPQGLHKIGPLLFRLMAYPFKAFVQQFIGEEAILNFADYVTLWNYPLQYSKDFSTRTANFRIFSSTAGSDMVIAMLAVPLILLLVFVYFRLKEQRNKRLIKFFFLGNLIIIFSVFPIVLLIPWLLTLFNSVTFIPSRYFYLISIGSSILFSLFVYSTIKWKASNYQKAFKIALIILISSLLIKEFYLGKGIINRGIGLGAERRAIVEYIKAVNPTIQDKSIFYVNSNLQYFGFGALMVPFQTNFGLTLLSAYYPEKRYDRKFFTEGFLIEEGIDGEDYREIEGKGFGYYIRGENLINSLKKNKISPDQVYAFFYDGSQKILSSKTDEVRIRLKQEFNNEKKTKSWNKFFSHC